MRYNTVSKYYSVLTFKIIHMSAKLEIPNARNLIDEYLSGKPVGEMLKREGFSQIVFNRLLREFGVDKIARVDMYKIVGSRLKKRKVKVPEAQISAEYADGASELALSKKYGVSRSAIKTTLRRTGTKRRTASEAETIKWKAIKQSKDGIVRQCSAAWVACKAKGEERKNLVLESAKKSLSTAQIMHDAKCSRPNVKRIIRNGCIVRDIGIVQAAGREFTRSGAFVSSYEIPLLECLTRYGVNAVHQQAIGTCNIDIGIPDSRIAVEVERRYFSESKSLRRERVENIISAGWRIIVVYDPMCNGIAYDTVAKNIATVSKLVSLNPSIHGKYGVIRGHGKYSARPSFDLYGLPRIFGL